MSLLSNHIKKSKFARFVLKMYLNKKLKYSVTYFKNRENKSSVYFIFRIKQINVSIRLIMEIIKNNLNYKNK